MEIVMTTLAQSAPRVRETTAAPALGRFRRAAREAISRAFYRVTAAIYASRSKRAGREIAQHLANRGTPLTDAVEREIAQRLMGGGWSRR
jgi:hypothetical protein